MNPRRLLTVAAALFLFLPMFLDGVAAHQQELETRVQHGNFRSNRTWTINYEFLLCGDIRITRIDRQRIDVPSPVATVMPHQRFSIQWSYQPTTGNFSLLDMLIAISRERYQVRVWVETPEGVGLKYFYFSPFGGSKRRIPPLPNGVAENPELLHRWVVLHDYTPPFEHNPEIPAFNVEFLKLGFKRDSRMDFRIILGEPGCGEDRVSAFSSLAIGEL